MSHNPMLFLYPSIHPYTFIHILGQGSLLKPIPGGAKGGDTPHIGHLSIKGPHTLTQTDRISSGPNMLVLGLWEEYESIQGKPTQRTCMLNTQSARIWFNLVIFIFRQLPTFAPPLVDEQ